MPLNKLENFIKNTEGRILYVNPNDLDATDSISNQGNSLAQPFKTIQRALLESARFSYLRGSDNDIVEKTTILVYPGEHLIDNRPGYAIRNDGGTPRAKAPNGTESVAEEELTLTLSTNFDLTQEDNILYKFNSVYGGIVVPRGTSIVGMDLRKTKVRPKYVPNPTDSTVDRTAIFRITGGCYFWQFTFFDGDENGLVYTDDNDFSTTNQAKPTFSHHKLTCFEYADGINDVIGYDLSDLDMYYSKLSNAFNLESTRNIDQKYPNDSLGFSKQRPEWEIVGAFGTDPISVSGGQIISGDGATPGTIVTVTTPAEHGLNVGTPVKVKGVSVLDYNISTTVKTVISPTQFTYQLPFVRDNLPAAPNVSSATVTIETDTVSGSSPYIFNCSLRSVYGMNGMLADGKKSSGFKSMVVAQFTGVSLQKDDRAFVKYNKTSRLYEGIAQTTVKGSSLSSQSSSLDPATVYHLDSGAVYRSGWEGSHIKIINDAVMQVVSVFAIGFNKHFDIRSGGDASITNSNSNFGQISLSAEGFKKTAFVKDNKAFVTNIIKPLAIVIDDENIDWTEFDIAKTKTVGISSHLYILGYEDKDDIPPTLVQGYKVGAKFDENINVRIGTAATVTAPIHMLDNVIGVGQTIAIGNKVSHKTYDVVSGPDPTSYAFTVPTHTIQTGEKVMLFSDDGDLPENIEAETVYYAIRDSDTRIRLASTFTNANNNAPIKTFGGSKVSISSRVHDKEGGDVGSPVQWDDVNQHWFIHLAAVNDVWTAIAASSNVAKSREHFITRKEDTRSLDEKLYKVRVVIPKEFTNAKNPEEGFIIQESSSTGIRTDSDFGLINIDGSDYDYDKNPRFISTCTYAANVVTAITDTPHNLNVGDQVIVKNVTSSTNISGANDVGFNGTFAVTEVSHAKQFKYSHIDVDGVTHATGSNSTNDVTVRNSVLPRFERNNLQSNYYIYRNEVLVEHIENVQDGIYHLYVLKADRTIGTEFVYDKFSQNVVDLYPQLDKDNFDDNPPSSFSYAKRSPIGDVVTNRLKNSITREAADSMIKDFGVGLKITGVDATAGIATVTFDREHGLTGISTGSITGGATYDNGTYQNVRLLLSSQTGSWNGATARVVVSGGAINSVDIITPGSGYSATALFFDQTVVGAGDGNARYTVAASGLNNAVNDTIQITGVSTSTGGYYTVSATPSSTSVAIAKTSGDPTILVGEYALNLGPSIAVSSDTYDTTTGISTFTCSSAHGLIAGSRFKIVDSSNNNLGDYIVKDRISVTNFSAETNANLAGARILPHGMSAANSLTNSSTENICSRGVPFYDNQALTLVAAVGSTPADSILRVSPVASGTGILVRLPLGAYIQIDNEIMRVTSSTLTGSGNDSISVIRGSLGSAKQEHAANSLIKKIKPRAIEFRRPSIIRASGHTFEYLGYGPGNYSTSLPQIQDKSLTEREEFLSQAQERAAGAVVYTGMNNRGDFYIGNKRVSSTTGQERTFDAPVPTVTGQDPSRLSVVFDEVTVKERIIVEGGKSNRVLSKFDGPVSFNRDIKVNGATTLNGTLKLNSNIELTNDLQSNDTNTGSIITDGGIGLDKNLNVGGDVNVAGITTFQGAVTFNTSLLPDADEGAALGSATLPWSGAHIDEIRIGVTADTEIDTVTGNLILDSAGGTVQITDDLEVTGTTAFTGNTSSAGATNGSVQIGITNNTEIDTTAGNLTLDSAGGTVNVDDYLTCNEIKIGGSAVADPRIRGDIVASTLTFHTQGALGATGNEELRIDATKTHVKNNLEVDGTTTLSGNTTVAGSLTITGGNLSLGSNNFLGGGGTFGNIKVGVTGDNEIDTTSGNLILDSAGGTVQVTDNITVSGSTTLSSTLNVSGTTTLGNNLSVTGQGSFTGNLIAFVSDDRLKTNRLNITGALDKVASLSGFTFNFNETAAGYGYNTEELQVGVSAQEVQAVLPEAVKPAPVDSEYNTVQYEKLVPLLIEAIKELKAEVEELKNSH